MSASTGDALPHATVVVVVKVLLAFLVQFGQRYQITRQGPVAPAAQRRTGVGGPSPDG
ncbi:hypothetical protein [Actinopolyspora erythraea]|nr:hypothetical protein [Actinopolyspora erythraea]